MYINHYYPAEWQRFIYRTLCVILLKTHSEILNLYQELVFLRKIIDNGKEHINTARRIF